VERIRGHSGQPSHSGDRKAIHKALQKPDKSLMHNIRVSTKHTYKSPFVLLSFFLFGHCVVCPSIYGF
jgi:hypothetical protein